MYEKIDFVSRDEVIDNLCESCFMRNCSHDCDAIKAIRRTKPADVRPVARAKWDVVEKPLEKATICECSECKNRIWMYDGDDGWNFCPNCGADMTEVKADG